MITVKRVVLVLVVSFVSTAFGTDHDGRGFRTKALRSHRKSEHDNLASLSSGAEISYSGGADTASSFGAGLTGAGEQGSKLAEAGLTSIKAGGDQVKENVEAAAKAFIDAFLQTFKEGVEDLKLALDDHYSSNGGNVKFNFKHSSENNNNGDWRTNTITCTSLLGSEPSPASDLGKDDGFFNSREDAFSLRGRTRGSGILGSSGKGRLSFDAEDERVSESSGKGKFAFTVGGNNSGGGSTGSTGKAKLAFGAEEKSDFSDRRGKIEREFATKSKIDSEGSEFSGPLGNFGFSLKNSGSSATASSGAGSYSGRTDSDDQSSASGAFGLSGKSSDDSDGAGRAGFSFGSGLGSDAKSSTKFSLGGNGGSSAKFTLGRLRRGRPVSRIDYAIQDERPWRDYILKYPESPYMHSYGSHSITPTYVNYPHN